MNIEYIKLSVGNYNVYIDSIHAGSIHGRSKDWQLLDLEGFLISTGRTRDQAVKSALNDGWPYTLQAQANVVKEDEDKRCNDDQSEYNDFNNILQPLTNEEINALSNELKDEYTAHYRYMIHNTTVHVAEYSIAMVVGGVVSSCAVYFDNPLDSCLDKTVSELYNIILDTEFKEHEPVSVQADTGQADTGQADTGQADRGLAEDYQPVAQRQSKLDKLIGKISRAYRRMVNAIKLM